MAGSVHTTSASVIDGREGEKRQAVSCWPRRVGYERRRNHRRSPSVLTCRVFDVQSICGGISRVRPVVTCRSEVWHMALPSAETRAWCWLSVGSGE